jgi:NADPH:quinone reductase-like Zn-dependent oxidoreductase
LTAVAVWSGWAYLQRSVADRYDAFSYPVASLADLAAEHPGSAVIVDDYTSMDVAFVDFDRPPAIFAPGSRIADPGTYSEILALNRDDLAKALGPELGSHATAVAWDPSGAPVVWAVVP